MALQKGVIIGIVIFIFLVIGVIFLPLFNRTDDFGGMGGKSKNVKNSLWMNAEFKDIRTGVEFSISGLKGKPVLLESFAVWCPKCAKQQEEIKKLHAKVGDSVVSISLDTDSNEDETRVKEHIESKGYDWYYAVSPIEVTKALIDEYGTDIVNAPSTPVILICKNGEAKKLKSGIKTADDLEAEIVKC